MPSLIFPPTTAKRIAPSCFSLDNLLDFFMIIKIHILEKRTALINKVK